MSNRFPYPVEARLEGGEAILINPNGTGSSVQTALNTAAIAALAAIGNHRVQKIGPVSAPGTTVQLDSAPFTLLPSPAANGLPGSPTVKVTADISLTGTAGNSVAWSLVRDRGTGSAVTLLREQSCVASATGAIAAATLVFLDTVDAVDQVTLLPAGLTEGSTHTYSIVATAAAALTGIVAAPASILLEQEPGGTSVTVGAGGGTTVPLGTAALFASFGSAGITNSGPSSITGDIGTPSSQSSLTGFAEVPASNGGAYTSAASAQVIGALYAANMTTGGTPAKVTQAAADSLAAYTDAQGRVPATDTNVFGGHLGGQTLTPGIHKFTTAVEVGAAPLGNLTLNGAGIYIFQIAGTFDLAAATSIILAGGALPQNVFWAIAGAVTIHANAAMVGEILAATNVAMQTGATLRGRALAQTGVTLIQNTIVEQ